jgi:hypothetical protein
MRGSVIRFVLGMATGGLLCLIFTLIAHV